MSTKSVEILSDITVFSKYARYVESKNRRETWAEMCIRNRDMHIDKYPQLTEEITKVYDEYVIPKKVLPSMRSLQFGGKPITLSPNRIYNCCYLPVDDYRAFGEIMFLLLGGTGVGYSVQSKHVEKLPSITKPTRNRRFVISDSIEGWADAVKALMKAYMCGRSLPLFVFDDIREKGAPLITSGGKAPGPQPLKDCLYNIKKILDSVDNGEKLSTIQVHDIVCYVADAVLAGGIRRAALISLFDIDDDDMLTCKFGNWWELNPQRGRANNSAVIVRHKVKREDFDVLWNKIRVSGSGEPGMYFTNNAEWGTNPCCEIALKPFQFCNLVEINFSNVESQQDLNDRSKAAAFLGTLQAGYTDFHYLRNIWKQTTEREALLGVSGTGICSGEIFKYDLKEAADTSVEENARVADMLGIRKAARVTAIKPAGTTSMVLGTSSGIHAWHAPYYVRRMRVGKNEAIYGYVNDKMPKLVEDDVLTPNAQAILSFPIEAPRAAIFRDESALDLLTRVKKFHSDWIKPGHRKGDNTHNVSATVSIKDDEWDTVGEWMWKNRDCYNGLSVLPYDGGSYVQAPFEEITEDVYKELVGHLEDIDLTDVKEFNDNTDQKGEIACSGGVCELVM